ncbi:hypothetical protein MTR_4g104400 [Medicago truncatula]|uniref:Uncharacterized protein n=1 Tax=Medicago truncatula TaxID=3880 RepID=A0A072URP7_MEDTR|nr:hypothetical protein MTR_4g104400 [Medicago truncatula]
MNSNKRHKVNNGHNPLSDITNGGVAFRKLMPAKPGKHILKHKGGGLYGKENSEQLKENNVSTEYVSERGKENEVPHNTQVGELRDRRVSIQEMDLDTECNENGEVSEIPENASDYYSVGELRFICPWCGAIMWYEERVSKHTDTSNPEFSLCCMQGIIEIAPFKRLP